MKTQIKRGTAKEKILEVSSDLFYRQGYNATGIQQIIDEAGVSKGTFYTHFKTKDDLGVAYLDKRHHDEITYLNESLGKIKDPHKRYLSFTPNMKKWMKESGYRGCAFSNMTAEIVDGKSPIRKVAKCHYQAFRKLIRDMVEDLLKSSPKYKKLDLDYVADQYMLIQIGAITNSEIYQEVWPFDQAQVAVKKLIGE